MSVWRGIFISVLCVGWSAAFAAEQVLQSGPQRTTMIELYTSEGCNSCPPAEHFLNSLTDDKRLWKTYIPLALHVDYWDYLGWRDHYATAANSERQRTYGKLLQARTIYTPEFIVNGKEWRRGFFGGLPATTSEQAGVLRVVRQDRQLSVSYLPESPGPSSLQLHVAVLGMGLNSDIRAGENAGRRTTHQFVLLSHTQLVSDKHAWQTVIPPVGNFRPARKALVVWVSEPGNPTPLQATGGFLPH